MTKQIADTFDDILASARFWYWARVLFVVLCVGVGGALSSGGCACAPRASSSAGALPLTESEQRSVVTLVRGVLQVEDFGEHAGQARLSYAPYCSAFALERGAGVGAGTSSRGVLVTAAHCVSAARLTLGSEARYREPSGWGLGSATVALVNEARDYAELSLPEGHGLLALRPGTTPHEGAYVTSPSAFFGESTAGRVLEAIGPNVPAGRFLFNGAIEHGWSGAPVLDVRGRAVGVVVKCVTDGAGGPCAEGVIAGAL